MAKQESFIKLRGSMGDVSFFKSKDGYHTRLKGAGLSAERIQNDPKLQRVRENGQEFGRAGKACKLLRSALRALLINTADGRVIGRLTREFLKVIKADPVNTRGNRNVMKGEVKLLTGFQFNAETPLDTVLLTPFTSVIDRSAGQLTVTLAEFIPTTMLRAPQGATHFKIISACAEIDFENGVYLTDSKSSDVHELLPEAVVIPPLVNTATPASVHQLFLVAGIEFYQIVNGQHYPLGNVACNALAIVNVDGGA